MFFKVTAPTVIYTLSLHDALPISRLLSQRGAAFRGRAAFSEETFKDDARMCFRRQRRSEEHTSELQSLAYLVCRLLLEKKKHTLGASLNIRHNLSSSKGPKPLQLK